MPSSQQLRHAQWQALHTTSTVSDKITVHNLQVIAKAGVDAWGRKKPQPALVTVALSLAGSFDSAAAADALDQSTVHYGQLSKRIKSAIDGSVDHVETRILAEQIIAPAIKETAGEHGNLKAFEIDIFYPKASMYGAGAGYSYSFFTSTQTEFAESKVLYLRDVRIPCIIGINPNERQQKQPVVVNLWIERVDRHRSNDYTKLETMLVQVRPKRFHAILHRLIWNRPFRNLPSRRWNPCQQWLYRS